MDLYVLSVPEQVEILRKISEPVENFNKELTELTDEMVHFMVNNNGIGLAAPQIGINKRFFVVKIDKSENPIVMINPEIIETSEKVSTYEEGCLSIPGVWAKVSRPSLVKIQGWNQKGRPFTITAEGILATCLQHEFDHLNGTLFVDHLSERKKDKILRKLQG